MQLPCLTRGTTQYLLFCVTAVKSSKLCVVFIRSFYYDDDRRHHSVVGPLPHLFFCPVRGLRNAKLPTTASYIRTCVCVAMCIWAMNAQPVAQPIHTDLAQGLACLTDSESSSTWVSEATTGRVL